MRFKELSVTFHTDKIRECVDFYGTYFHSRVTFDSDWYVVIRLEGDIPLSLSFQGSHEEMPGETFAGGVSLNLMVEDVDNCYALLKEAGVSFVEEITDHQWGDRAFSLYDPIGNLLYIYSERAIHEKYKNAVKE